MKITDVLREDRPARKFGLRWWVKGKAKHKFFEAEEDRAKYRKKLEKQFRAEGELPFTMTAADAVEWKAARDALAGRGVSILEAVRSYVENNAFVRDRKTLPEAVRIYLDARKGEGNTVDYLRHVKTLLANFQGAFGDRMEISAEEARAWLFAQPVAPQTQVNYRKKLSAFYKFAVEHQWIHDSPWRAVAPPKVIEKEVEILTVDQAAYLFRANQDAPAKVLARLALEAFAGLRFASACRFAFEEVKWDQRGIELPAKKIKTTRRQFLDGLPDNLWSWLELCRDRSKDWAITERNYLYQKTAAFGRATLLYRQEHSADDPEGQIPHPRNCLRHSFATYHVAMNKSAARTAVILCHENQEKLWEHYKGNATEADGKRYFEIKPGA